MKVLQEICVSFHVMCFLEVQVKGNIIHKRTRRGAGGGAVAPPQLWRNFQKSVTFGQIFAFSRAKMLANNGLCVGPPPRFFLPVRL